MQSRASKLLLISILFVSACLAVGLPGTPPTQTPNPLAETAAPSKTSTATETATPLPPTATQVPPTNTATLIPTATPEPVVRFAVIGDFGLAGKPEADVAQLITSWQLDFIITTGDNNYPNGAQETIDENIGQYYSDYISPYFGNFGSGGEINRFFPTLGNHDWVTNRAQAYFDYFTLPGNERYYDFVWDPVHLFALNSDSREPDGVGQSSIQAQWLKEKLAVSTSPWKIIYMHQPPYSSAHHGPTNWIQWPFKEWGATAVLAGHDHVYERLIINNLPYFVNGLGGSPSIYWFESPLEGSQLRYRDDNGAMLVTATSEEITFEFITRTGALIDSYTIYNEGVPDP
jgi:tartrate-resistant acid phosphatase type 5